MYKALKNFCGKITMRRGEIKEITDPSVISDLIRAGYIEKIQPEKEVTDSPKNKKSEKKRKKK